jgi:o-succinylbenzoate synthase
MTTRLQFRRYRLPLRRPVRTAHGLWAEREGVIVRLQTDAGAIGLGEAATIPWFGTETADEAESACRDLGEWGGDERFDSLPGKLRCLRNAVASARSTIAAASANESKATAEDERASYLPVAALLPGGRAVLAEIGPKAESGFRVFKWKVGVGDVADELALLDDVCAALPAGAKLRLDANGAWDRRRAERWLERCAERPVEFVEQPVDGAARGAEDLLCGLAQDWPTPVALDESIASDADVEHWIGLGWPGVFVVKPSLLADAPATLARLARARGPVVFSSALETAVGAQAALRLAFAWRGEPRALGFGVWPLFAEARFDGPAAAPFVRREDVERINPEAVWTALS